MKKRISFCAALLLSFASSPVSAGSNAASGANALPVLPVLILAATLLKLWISFPFFLRMRGCGDIFAFFLSRSCKRL